MRSNADFLKYALCVRTQEQFFVRQAAFERAVALGCFAQVIGGTVVKLQQVGLVMVKPNSGAGERHHETPGVSVVKAASNCTGEFRLKGTSRVFLGELVLLFGSRHRLAAKGRFTQRWGNTPRV